MNKIGRLKKSRARWKEKASARAEEIRERRKSEKRLKTRIEELGRRIKTIKKFILDRKIADNLEEEPDYCAEGSGSNESLMCVNHCVDHDSV